MRVYTTDPLFAWERLEDSPGLRTLRRFLDSVPDGALLESLRRFRGRGRDDDPVSVLWNTLLLTIVLRHSSIEACLGELARNRELRRLIGIESEQRVPKTWNLSRFLEVLGREPARGTLKYRCPARDQGWTCPSDNRCNGTRLYGLTVRVPRESDLRRFPPIPRATKQFERLYKGRSAVERVNARVEVFWGADDGNIVGATRLAACLGTVRVVHAGLATLLASCPRHEGTLGRMRLSPIAKTLPHTPSG